MQRAGVFLLVLTTVSGIGLRGQVPAESRTFLLFYDDLHMEFGSTPRIRELTLRMVTDLAREGDRWALVSTGTSSVSVAPTSDAAIVKSAIRRVTGNGLTARSFLDARQQTDGVLETRRRAALAFSTATDAIEGVSAAQSGRPLAILYVSNGYDVGAIAEPNVPRRDCRRPARLLERQSPSAWRAAIWARRRRSDNTSSCSSSGSPTCSAFQPRASCAATACRRPISARKHSKHNVRGRAAIGSSSLRKP
jgi:hypothetical protein